MQINPVPAVSAVQPTAEPSLAPGPADPPAAKPGSVRLLNPQPVIDPALGIVITEYFNKAGRMTEQYPSAKAIDSYRMHESGTGTAVSGRDVSSGQGQGVVRSTLTRDALDPLKAEP